MLVWYVVLFFSLQSKGWVNLINLKKRNIRSWRNQLKFKSTPNDNNQITAVESIRKLPYPLFKKRDLTRKSLLLSLTSFISLVNSLAPSSVSAKTDEDLQYSEIIEKQSSDDREYKYLTLSNGLRVLLISDPSTVRSAAALDVHVGSFSDPKEIPGLAHFAEHSKRKYL
jgi:hypothetical protein